MNTYNYTVTTTFGDLTKQTHLWDEASLQSILMRCAESFGTTTDEIKSRSRTEMIVLARHAYCYKAYYDTRLSHEIIGKFIERDHATVWNSIKVVKEFIKIGHKPFTNIYNKMLIEPIK